MAMFVGLIDGDGYFDIGEQKQQSRKGESRPSTIRIRLAINLASVDLPLLKYIQSVLGCGVISIMPNGQYRLVFYKPDLLTIIFPLMRKFNLSFLVSSTLTQFNFIMFILDNDIVKWDKIGRSRSEFAPTKSLTYMEYVGLPQFKNWVVGFSIAEGSFSMKANGDGFYSIRQTGALNLEVIKAIQFLLLGELRSKIKPDSANSYKLHISARADVQLVINFFSFSGLHPLIGNKASQYNIWIGRFKLSSRYGHLNFPPV
uniref:LAGLIDADG endonuclease n=1 Tax=Powellomyces hirtus TaxID=109895 RepID=A0A4P8NX54_9FUNG|nr:LAGLIDADG endonuclease [Powellomyces hirtus]